MVKNLTSIFKKILPNKTSQKELKNALGDDVACYVLITCTNPDSNGNMDVDLIYEGDRDLASYLIKSAQGALD